jgi:hypothetical protein
MTKNTTRKGIAFGAGLALVASGFAGLPASAAGVDNGYVVLAPSSGTQYDQLQALTLDLTGSFVNAAASGAKLKYLVTDTDKVFKADVDVNDSSTADTNSVSYGGGSATAALAAGVVTVTTTTAHTLVSGDRVTISGLTSTAGADDANGVQTVIAVTTASPFTFTYKVTTSTGISGTPTVAYFKTAETGNALRAEIAAADLGSRSILGTSATIGARATDGSFVVDTQDTNASGADNVLRLVSTAAADTSATATVTAWIDNNNDGEIQASEYASPTRTIRFLKTADVTFTTAFDTLVLGGTTQSATVSISGVNMSQIAAGVIVVDFKTDGASTDADANTTYSTTTKVLEASASQAITAGVYSAQADYAAVNYGSIVYKTVTTAATDISSVTAAASVGSANVSGSSVKTGTTSVLLSSTAKYWSAYSAGVESAAPAGVPAVVTITKTTLAVGSTVSAGGKTLASTDTSISFDTTTNALGKVAFDLSATGTKGTVVTVDVKVQDENTTNDNGTNAAGTTGGYKVASTTTLTWADQTIASIDLATALGFGGEMGIAKGSVNTLSYDIRDNFGASSAVAGTYRVNLAIGTITGGASWTGSAPVSAGKASYTFTDNTVTATGVYTVTATLEKLNTAGTAYATTGLTTTTVVRVGSSAATTVSATTAVTTGSGIALDPEAFSVHDYRLDANSATFPYTAAGFQVTGTVRDNVGAPVAGVAVVVASAGVAFAAPQSGNFTTYTDSVTTIGSATVYTNAAGAYSVTAWSHMAGTNTFTVTSGAASATTSALWAFATNVDKDSKITIVAPASVSPASVAKGSVTITDVWGNIVKGAVAITFTQTGPGYIVTVPTVVSATTGSADFVLLTGSNDTGSVVITATHGSNTAATTDDVTATATIMVGEVESATKVNVGTFKGYVALYAKGYEGQKMSAIVAGKWIVVESLASDFERVVRFTGAGYTITTKIYIDGEQIGDAFTTVTK